MIQLAKKLTEGQMHSFGPKSLGTLKDLVAFRFQNNPIVISQVWPLLDPTAKPQEWGKGLNYSLGES